LPLKEDPMPRHTAATLGSLVVLVVTGCSGQSSPPANIDGEPQTDVAPYASASRPAETFSYPLIRDVEYYTSGPQQGRPPDGTLSAGTKVNVLRRTGSYSLVRTAEGVEGYIASDAIQDQSADALE
jgi:hypothetical protein